MGQRGACGVAERGGRGSPLCVGGGGAKRLKTGSVLRGDGRHCEKGIYLLDGVC